MEKAGRKKRINKGMPQRLLAVLAVSLLFLVCLVVDCWQKGLFSHEQKEGEEGNLIKEIHRQSREKKGRDEKNIRVLLTGTDQSSVFHEVVTVRGTKKYKVKRGGKEESHPAGEEMAFYRKDVKKAGKAGIVITCPEGRIKVTSISRRQNVPSYRGSLTLTWNSQGILVKNTLPLGKYLYGVVSSEMSSEYPLEALKAQAVCARSFAWRQMESGTYKKYGADVDDTTAFQVYNMAGEDSRTRRAVDGTRGKMLFHGKKVITAFYYSTSWGCSATLQEVWGGGDLAACYPRRLQITEESSRATKLTSLDLSDEKIFGAFISQTVCDTYDGDSGWYRWKVRVAAKALGASMGIGTVKKIQVVKRGKSGILSKIRIIGTRGRRTVTGQQSIRERLMVPGSAIERQDGSTVELSMLPSAAFKIQDAVNKKGVYFLFTGGGFGHGAGMSQNGAAAMAKAGKSYKEILMHYYKDCKLK